MQEVILHLRVNGDPYAVAVPPHLRLVDLLREKLGLTGTKIGCGTGDCGACTVLLDGRTVNSCLTLALEAEGCEVTTIEGVAPGDGRLHPLQEAFIEHGATQCGFCTPGMVVSALHLLEQQGEGGLTEAEIRRGLGGNLCRCTGYTKIVEAVQAVVDGASGDDAGQGDHATEGGAS
jgi:carbon-monoxide dehydrogenase small subunit